MNQMSCSTSTCSSENSVPPRKNVKGVNWTDEETKVFLEIFIDKRIISLLDGKKFRHLDIYKTLEKEMLDRGFLKTAQQMKLKMTKLKQLYFKCKRDNEKSGSNRRWFQFYSEMDLIFGDRPNSTIPDSEDVVDTGNELRMDDTLEPEEPGEEPFVEAVLHEVPTNFQVDSSPIEIVYVDKNDTPEDGSKQNESPQKRKGKKKGKKSYIEQVEEIQKNTMKVLSEFCTKQANLTSDLMRSESEKQREWESELMQREHDFQQSQMEILLRTIQFQQMPPFSPYPSYSQQYFKQFSESNDGRQLNLIYPSTSRVSNSVNSHSTAPTNEVNDFSDDSSTKEN